MPYGECHASLPQGNDMNPTKKPNISHSMLPQRIPIAFTKEFGGDAQKHTQRRAFVRRFKPEGVPESLDSTVAHISAFLMPILDCIRNGLPCGQTMPIGGPWRDKTK
jgi:hypothetical protein